MHQFWIKIGPLATPLLICSTVALAIIIERTAFFVRELLNKQSLEQKLADTLQKIAFSSKQEKEEAVSLLIFKEHVRCTKYLRILQLTTGVSPMLGLLGTTLGIIETFQEVALSSGPVLPHMLAGGLWQAILTTAIGIGIGIFSLTAHGIFSMVANQRSDQLYIKANELILLKH